MRKEVIKPKELLVVLGVLFGLVLLLAASSFFFRKDGDSQATDAARTRPVVVSGVIGEEAGESGESSAAEPESDSPAGSQAYFLEPSADEVLQALRESEGALEEPPPDQPPMKVIWPGYFFGLEQSKTGETLMQLDVDESGFGVILVCTVSLADYPELTRLTAGQRIWVAGAVTAIDLEGTGRVFIEVDYIRFDEGPVRPGQQLPPRND